MQDRLKAHNINTARRNFLQAVFTVSQGKDVISIKAYRIFLHIQ